MKAVVLLSGGLDSSTVLAWALRDGAEAEALYVSYGQRHSREEKAARKIADHYQVPLSHASFSTPWGGSALVDTRVPVPVHRNRTEMQSGIPVTYVPARNTILLGLSASLAETVNADYVYVGFNAIDFSGYPDCRPQYIEAMNRTLHVGTKRGVEGRPILVRAPLLRLTKADIVRKGHSFGVPFELTWSCYMGGQSPCEACDACLLRSIGFKEVGLTDPLLVADRVVG